MMSFAMPNELRRAMYSLEHITLNIATEHKASI